MSIYSAYSDVDLIHLVKKEDELAFKELYERFSGLLYVQALKKTKNEDEAKDIVQDIFIALWNKRAELHFHSSVSSYLFKAVHNRALNLFVHQKYHDDYVTSLQNYINQGPVEADALLREKEMALIIDRAIQDLPEKMREIFQLSRYEHLSHKEIADKLGISELTVKTQVKRALRAIRTNLGPAIYLLCLLYRGKIL